MCKLNFNKNLTKQIGRIYSGSIRLLTGKIGKPTAYLFAHGFLHIVIFISCITCFWLFFDTVKRGKQPNYHKIRVEMDNTLSFRDSVCYFSMEMQINSDTLKAKTCFSSSLSFSYTLNNFNDTADIKIYKLPYDDSSPLQLEPSESSPIVIQQETNDSLVFDAKIPQQGRAEAPLGYTFGPDHVTLLTNDLISEEDNPYYYVDIDLDIPCYKHCDYKSSATSCFIIKLGDWIRFGNDVSTYSQGWEIKYIYPQPTIIRSDAIMYMGEDFEKLLNWGRFVFQAVDVEKKNIDEREGFRDSVLLGALLGFILTVMIEIFSKWKRLNDRVQEQ